MISVPGPWWATYECNVCGSGGTFLVAEAARESEAVAAAICEGCVDCGSDDLVVEATPSL